MRVVICGAGGHGKVAWDVFRAAGHEVVGFLDDDPSRTQLLDLPVAPRLELLPPSDGVHVAIGDNRARMAKFEAYRTAGLTLLTAVHPTAVVSSRATLGTGVLVLAGVVINIDTVIGDNVIINTGATVDHDNEIGSHVHVAPGVVTGGGVSVGAGAFLGIGTRIVPGKRIGTWATCGAGAVVVKDVPAGITVVGVPAQPLRECNENSSG